MVVQRDVGDISTNPGGKSGAEWTSGVRQSVQSLWSLNGGRLLNVAGTNAITADALVPAGFTSYGDGLRVGFIAENTNTGAMTLNISGIGIKALLGQDGLVVASGGVVAGRFVEAVFNAAEDAFRLVSASGTTNVTVEGGIIRQRSAPARLVVAAGPTTAETVIGSVNFQCEGGDSTVIVEGSTTRVTASASADPVGVKIRLYVDGDLATEVTDYCAPSQQASSPIYFAYTPNDADAHTYEVRVASVISATYPASSNVIWLSEISPNS